MRRLVRRSALVCFRRLCGCAEILLWAGLAYMLRHGTRALPSHPFALGSVGSVGSGCASRLRPGRRLSESAGEQKSSWRTYRTRRDQTSTSQGSPAELPPARAQLFAVRILGAQIAPLPARRQRRTAAPPPPPNKSPRVDAPRPMPPLVGHKLVASARAPHLDSRRLRA